MAAWPTLIGAPDRFRADFLSPALALRTWVHTDPQAPAGNPGGPRHVLWTSTVALAVASMEAGLEDLFLAAHARRLGVEGQPRDKGIHGEWMVEDALQAPGPEKIRQLALGQFAVDLRRPDLLPASAQFQLHHKPVAAEGGGQGTVVADWGDLYDCLLAATWVRHATAHQDIQKLTNTPTYARGTGYMWAKQAGAIGAWRVQQPHCSNALRAVVAVHNFLFERLAAALGVQVAAPTTPVSVVVPAPS